MIIYPRRQAYLIDPSLPVLRSCLEEMTNYANGTCRRRRVDPISPWPILNRPAGYIEQNGKTHPAGRRIATSTVAAAWFTMRDHKCVRLWSERDRNGSSPATERYIVGRTLRRADLRTVWRAAFPERWARCTRQRQLRVQRLIESFGPPGDDDRLAIRRPHYAAFARGLGFVIADHPTRPRVVQVIVRDSTTGLRHALTVPPRFGDPRSSTFRDLGTNVARVQAAIAWTFRLPPDAYRPQLEA